MTEDEFQAFVTSEAAKAIGQWLEARGKLHQPIRQLRMAELEAMAVAAVGRFVGLREERRRSQQVESADPTRILPM